MLRLPREGFRLSVSAHNVSPDALIEWIEGSITFADDRVTQSDVIDILTEEDIYRSQDFAREALEIAWAEMARRQKALGSYCPYSVDGQRIRRILEWPDTPAYSFCLLLALQVRYRDALDAAVPRDYITQGSLFERLTLAALSGRGMAVHSTAWSKVASTSIRERVADLAEHLGERTLEGGIEHWAEPQIKDGGLDVVCNLPFPDGWGGRPLYLVQCASGENWREKKATPKVALWEKLIDFTTKPMRGFAMPFALLEDEFRREANDDLLALFLDRHRLGALSAADPSTWPGPALRLDLNAWTRPRADALPRADE
jgi:hypothetical protein